MLVIPAIDLKDGQCVRLRQGRMDEATIFSNNPIEMAGRWLDQGARRLHVVDLNGAFSGTLVNAQTVAEIAKAYPELSIQIGGGIRNLDSVKFYMDSGVDFVIIGTAAIKDPEFLVKACDMFPEKIIVGVDAIEGKVATEGWADISEVSTVELIDRFLDTGVAAVIYTDISRDGMMKGCNIEATIELASQSQIPIIASGGVAKLADIVDLKAAARSSSGVGIIGVITGRAIYEGTLDLREAQKYCDGEDSKNDFS